MGTPLLRDMGLSFSADAVHGLFVFQTNLDIKGWFERQLASVLLVHDPLEEGLESMPYVIWPDSTGDDTTWSPRAIESSLGFCK